MIINRSLNVGRIAREAIEHSRELVADMIDAPSEGNNTLYYNY